MKKILAYILFLIFLCFFIPLVFTNRKAINVSKGNTNKNGREESSNSIQENSVSEEYNYNQYGKVKLLHTETNKIEELDLDEYVYGVVASEMPASFEIEALKAQAIVARTYTIYKIINNDKKHEGADICDDSTCCQAWISKEDRMKKWDDENKDEYWNKIVSAVDSTKGKIITYEGKPINAFFHANSGGKTETPINVWGGSDYPYLQTVATSGEDAYSQYSSEIVISKGDFEKKIKDVHGNFNIDFSKKDCIKIEEYTDGGRVKSIKIGNLKLSGVEIRNILGLKSANFEVKTEEDNIVFKVIGYGHGVGMSQTGADSLAKQGKGYEDIIKHFYKNVEIENI